MSKQHDIGLEDALSKTLNRLTPLSPVALPVDEVCGLVVAEDAIALVDCPSATTSLKDGYAVVSEDLKSASEGRPARLKMAGMLAAGGDTELTVEPGVTVKVMTGAILPRGADAVVPVEFTREGGNTVFCYSDAPPGRNVLFRGSDVEAGQRIVARGEMLTPPMTGLLAAGGVHSVRVFPRPRVGIVATGDEVVAPGQPLKSGQLYASNLVTLLSWLRHFRMEGKAAVVADRAEEIRRTMCSMLSEVDVLLTSGGAWKSERDFTIKTLMEMGWELLFHRVRLGPGKAVALGLLNGKPVFCLPGGPASNEMAFLQIALPGLLQIAGRSPVPFELRKATLSAAVGGDITWTQFFQASLKREGEVWSATPQRMKSRLQSQARAEALIKVPEGLERLEEGEEIQVQVLF